MKIRDMQLIVRVAETGSMSLAARQLRMTPAGVSVAVQRIEGAIGVRLFERTTRALHPTDEGLVIIESCQDVVDRWQRALDDVRGDRTALTGTINVSAPADTAFQALGSIVADLCAEHPKLRIELHTSDAVQHLHRDAIDMAIRYGPMQDSTLTARKLAEAPGVFVASPAYLAEHGAPSAPVELADHRCLTIRLSGVPVVSWTARGKGEAHAFAIDSPLCGDGLIVRRWAVAGRGIALKSLFDVVDDLEAGRLIHVLPDYTSDIVPIHAVFPSRRFLPTRVRALDAAITAAFAARSVRCAAWIAAGRLVETGEPTTDDRRS